MKTFAQLFEERRGILDNGAYVRSRAPELLNATRLVFAEGMPSRLPNDGALLAIAFYSLPDLQFLDDIVERSRNVSRGRHVQMQVLDILICKSMEDIESLFPGLTPVYGTPIVGVWAKGELIDKGWGLRESTRIIKTLVR